MGLKVTLEKKCRRGQGTQVLGPGYRNELRALLGAAKMTHLSC